MSRIYDNWEKLVGAVLKREELRRLARCESLSSSIFSSRPSVDSDVPADPAAPSSQSIFAPKNIVAIPFEEIKLATQNFQPDMLLGEGRFGPVFKGWIHEHFLTAVKPGYGIAVAVKMLNKREIFSLNQPCHPNLVKLIGYSFEEDNRVLVYEFMPNGSLDNHLFTRGYHSFSWETRVKVAVGAARGLSFFHDSAIMVTHEGVKSSSILLDEEFNANLSIFDPTTVSSGPTHISTKNDYAAPEYIAPGRLTMKSDVYSFGIILLELLTGFRVSDKNRPIKEQNLVVWAKPYLRNKKRLLEIIDSRLEGQYPRDGAYKICKLASQCLSLDPKLRPRMTEVVDTLEQLSYLPQYRLNPAELPTGIDRRMDQSGWSNWIVIGPETENSGSTLVPVDPSGQSISILDDAMAIQFDVIKKATRNFRPGLLLGEGRSGPLYKGVIDEHPLTAVKLEPGIVVAVKKLVSNQRAGHRECLEEVNYWGKLRHPNLVKLIGYCFEADNRILVHEFMPCGSLDYHLFTRRDHALLWERRLKVAVGAARALAFFHELEKPYVHGIFSSGDILLDGEFNAKLPDYVLRRLTFNVGSRNFGYEAPEYVATGHMYIKSDVYSFGVVLLELLSGFRAYDRNRATKERKLVDWVRLYLGSERRLSQIMDPRLEGRVLLKDVYKVAKLASLCISLEPRARPSMAEVVAALDELLLEINVSSRFSGILL